LIFKYLLKSGIRTKNGKDVYLDTKEIVFFPSVMTVEANSQAGYQDRPQSPARCEGKDLPLFVQEIPTPKKISDEDIKKNIKAGCHDSVPVLNADLRQPLKPQESYNFDKIDMSKGAVTAIVKNTEMFMLNCVTSRSVEKPTMERNFSPRKCRLVYR